MKPFVLILSLLNVLLGIGQTTSSLPNTNTAIPKFKTNTVASIGDNGFKFNVRKTGGNSKFSEFGSGIFKGKFIMVSSKKIGGLAKVDKTTREANKELYCLEVDEDGELSDPLFFSRILNTSNSEDQLTFSSDESIVYYTRNSKEKPVEFKIYRATLEPNSHGNWINHERLSINQDGVSIENPFLSPDGQQLYFSSNREDALGGYDIYASRIDKDGKLSTPKNLGNLVNTTHNETHPSLSPDGKKLYFASQGHNNLGGYDIFVSRISQDGVKAPKNLGNTINTAYDELAYFIAKNNIGYISSNKPEGQGSFDVYIALDNTVKQFVKGVVKHSESQTLLPKTTVILKDEEGKELDKQLTDAKGSYVFEITPTKTYTMSTLKEGYSDKDFTLYAEKETPTTYTKNLEIESTAPRIGVKNEKLAIIVENVYFDFNKHNVKSESYITLDKIIKVLEDNPNIKLSINAHTDNIDTDAYNLRLASRRAKFILKYLTENNVDRNRLFYKAYGEKHPEIDCKNNCSKKELQANRRVEFLIFNDAPENTISFTNTKGNYHIIAGAFTHNNALLKIKHLKAEGFTGARSIGKNSKGLHLVTHATFKTKEEATKALKLIRTINNEEAWLKQKNIAPL